MALKESGTMIKLESKHSHKKATHQGDAWEQNNKMIYNFIISQRATKMRIKVQSLDDFVDVQDRHDRIELISLLSNTYYTKDQKRHSMINLVYADKWVDPCYQYQCMNCACYLRKFKARTQTTEYAEAKPGTSFIGINFIGNPFIGTRFL